MSSPDSTAERRSPDGNRPNFSERVKLNLVVCGCDGTLKSSISEQILRDVDLHGRVVSLEELPALIRLSEEEEMHQSLRCVSLCDPGVHVFLLIIPDAPLTDEDKAEMEKIQRIFSSRIHKHMMILIMQDSERQTAELSEETQAVIESFGGRHHVFGPTTQVSTLMESVEKMLEENRGEFFSTETFLEAQMEKLMKYEEMKKKIDSLETHLLPQGSAESEDDLRIVLLGKTGVGKSATGNTILGREAFTAEESFESVTKESQRESSEINGRRVTVIDTPGLFDTELTNEQIQREISNCISMILPGPHVFLLLIPLGRFTPEEQKSVKIIQETFGERSLVFTMVLFTRGDFLKKKTIDQCLGKPGSALMNLIEACGNRFHVFNNNETGDRTQVSDLLEKIDNMVKANGGSFYSCKMFRQMERQKQEQQMKILMDRVREREEEMRKLEEEKGRMKMMMEEERQTQEKERKRSEEELKQEIREQEKHQREMREEMRREREMFNNEMRQEKENVKKEKENLQTEIDRLINRIENERKKREEKLNESEERYKTLMKEKEDLQSKHEAEEKQMKIQMEEKLNREREELMKKHEEEKERVKILMEEERQNQEKERKRREEEFNEREERYKREMKEQEEQTREEMKRERETLKDEIKEMKKEKERVKNKKDNLQIRYDTEIDRLMNRIENERQNHDKERKGREEEFNEREERFKREIKEREELEREIQDEMKREREAIKQDMEEMKKEKETVKKEKENLQTRYDTEIERLMKRIENERENHDKERNRREEEFNEREKRLKTLIKEKEKKEREIQDQMRRQQDVFEHEMEEIRQEKEKIKAEIDHFKTKYDTEIERMRKKTEEELNERGEHYKTLMKEKEEREENMCEEMKRLKSEMEGVIKEKERIERERQGQLEDLEKRLTEERNVREDQQKTSEEKLRLLEEELKRDREENEQEKERIERERQGQLEDLEKRLTEERNMREDQQKTSEEKLRLIEEQHDKELKRRRVEYEREKEEMMKRISSDHSLQENEEVVPAGFRAEHPFDRLHLDKLCYKLRAADVLQISEHSLQSHESCAEEELSQAFLQKLLMMNYRARSIHAKETKEQHHTQQTDYEDEGDIFDYVFSMSNKGESQSERIHPMDVQMAVFHCADGFLKQLMVSKLSQCQYALPLLVPDPFTRQIEFPLWTFRQINKSWKRRNTNNEIISLTQPIYKAETPMVFFFRFGFVSSSKSALMNSLINEKHNTFFHRNCPGSSRTRVLMDGVVEIAWFCPSGSYEDKFTECVAFCNLHGNAGDHEKQLQILMEMASVNVVLLPTLEKNDRSNNTIIQNLYNDSKPLICLLTEDESAVTETRKSKYKIGLKDRNQSDVSEELRRAINDGLSESSHSFRLEDVSKHSDLRVDEEEDDDCRRGRAAAQQMMSLLEKKDLTKVKDSFLPHQGKLWHQWSQKNKDLHRPQGDETEMDISRKQTEMKRIRERQHKSDISEFMKIFITHMNSRAANKMYFLKWLRILLDEHTSADLSALHRKYDEKLSTVFKLREGYDKSEQIKAEEAELERISEDLQAAAFGVEHIMREIGQIYESCSSVKKQKKGLQFDFSSLPSLAAEMMISGFPLELMDEDAAHVPVVWISAVLDQLKHKLGDQRVFVLSVLGIQSSGKSTMLNAMFGLQFVVGQGRTTRGAFMQLIRLSDQMKTQMNTDYILVVDTGGLRALELAGRSTRHHDNEFTTFVVGLGNLTLINIFGENPSEMQDILQIVVQAFLRMKKVRLNPSCVFVHQNVSDITAGEKNMEGRRRLQETLDEMTKLAAKDEVCDAECFSDVIRFDVQNDVKYFAQLWEGSPPMAPPNPNYCENIQDLKKTIMSHASKSHGMRLIQLKDHIKDLWEALLKERFVFSFRNSLEISSYRKLETEYRKWTWSLRKAMLETEYKLHNRIEKKELHEVEETDLRRELKKTSEEVEKSMSEFFEIDRDKYIQWKTSFEIKVKELQENIVRETKRKLNEILQQRHLKKEIDAHRTHHEITLYEKSKELALKLKDRANYEETLKKEFDLFWEESVKKIIRDTPAIRDTDVMRDVREILSDGYGSVPVDYWRESRDMITVPSYSDYVIFKRSTKKGIIGVMREVYGFGVQALSLNDEDQIRSLVSDVVQQTDRMIQSFNISKMGYNKSFIHQLTDYIKVRITQHQEGSVKYVFKNEFFMDLVLSICERANKMITDQHRLFREANDPVIYVEKKRAEYYRVFLKYCHGHPPRW